MQYHILDISDTEAQDGEPYTFRFTDAQGRHGYVSATPEEGMIAIAAALLVWQPAPGELLH